MVRQGSRVSTRWCGKGQGLAPVGAGTRTNAVFARKTQSRIKTGCTPRRTGGECRQSAPAPPSSPPHLHRINLLVAGTRMRAHAHAHVCLHVCAHVCMCVHMSARTDSCTQTHKQRQTLQGPPVSTTRREGEREGEREEGRDGGREGKRKSEGGGLSDQWHRV